MSVQPTHRHLKAVAAGLLLSVAGIMVAIIAPAAFRDKSRYAIPGVATFVFLAAAVVHGILGWSVRGSNQRRGSLSITDANRSAEGGSGRVAVIALILGLVLLDVALDFTSHGEAMWTANAGMFLCAILDLASAGLIFTERFIHRPGIPETDK